MQADLQVLLTYFDMWISTQAQANGLVKYSSRSCGRYLRKVANEQAQAVTSSRRKRLEG